MRPGLTVGVAIARKIVEEAVAPSHRLREDALWSEGRPLPTFAIPEVPPERLPAHE